MVGIAGAFVWLDCVTVTGLFVVGDTEEVKVFVYLEYTELCVVLDEDGVRKTEEIAAVIFKEAMLV